MKFENVTSDLVVQLERCDEHLKVWRWSHQPMVQFCFFVGTRGFNFFLRFHSKKRNREKHCSEFCASHVQNWELDRCPFRLPQKWLRLWVIKESDTINGLWTSQLSNRSHQKWDGGSQIRHLRYRSYEKSLSKDQDSRSQNRIGVKKAQAHQTKTKNVKSFEQKPWLQDPKEVCTNVGYKGKQCPKDKVRSTNGETDRIMWRRTLRVNPHLQQGIRLWDERDDNKMQFSRG